MAKMADHRERTEYVFKDRTFSATYTVSSGMVHVTAIQGRKSAQWGDLTAQSVADQLFREIIHEADAAGTLRHGT
jgi:hypothetical protein